MVQTFGEDPYLVGELGSAIIKGKKQTKASKQNKANIHEV